MSSDKSEKYKGVTQEDIDREMQMRLEGGWETKYKSSKSKYEEEKSKFPTHEEIQAEWERHGKAEWERTHGQGSRYVENFGKRGGRYYERRSKNGNIYRQYF